MLHCFDFMREPSFLSAFLRLFAAMLFGGIMGMERGLKKRPAGFRTFILVTVGSAIVMITGQLFFSYYNIGDPMRFGAQVISGIGFLGAGTIIVTGRNQVRGLTTAAGLWACACVGLAVGSGFIEIALLGFFFIYISLSIFHRLDKYMVSRSKILDLLITFDSSKSMDNFTAYLRAEKIKITNLEFVPDAGSSAGFSIAVTLALVKRGTHDELIRSLSGVEGIREIEEIL